MRSKIDKIKYFTQKIIDVLALCVYKPTKNKLDRIINDYLKNTNMEFYCLKIQDIMGIIGILKRKNNIEIKHIAVSKNRRKMGIGKKLINTIRAKYKNKTIFAETDDETVEFYRKCGFNIINLGEKYPNIVRYKCIIKTK